MEKLRRLRIACLALFISAVVVTRFDQKYMAALAVVFLITAMVWAFEIRAFHRPADRLTSTARANDRLSDERPAGVSS